MGKIKIAIGLMFAGVFLVIGLITLYLNNSSNSENPIELNSAYVLKEKIGFKHLPKEIQDQYIHKNDLETLERLGLVQQSNSKELLVETDVPVEGSADELKAQIITLRQKNNFLYQDNMDLANKNWELALKLNDEQKVVEEERQKLITQNLEVMNEAEQQHYQNINDLTKRINSLQEESMSNSKKYENTIVSLENKIHELERELRQKSLNVDEEITAATKEQRISNSTLAEKNRYLLEQLKALEKNLGSQIDEKESRLQIEKAQVERLRVALQEKEIEQNNILTNHTKEILAVERKQNINIQKIIEDNKSEKQALQTQISDKNSEITSLITKHDNVLKKLRNESIELESKLQQERLSSSKMLETHDLALRDLHSKIDALRAENETLEKRIVTMKNSMETSFKEKADEYATALEEIKNHSLQSGERESIKVKALKEELNLIRKSMNEKEQSAAQARAELDEVKLALEKAINSNAKNLEENERKHADNYAHLNEKIVNIEREKALILNKANSHIDDINKNFIDEKSSFNNEFLALKNEFKKLEKENISLKLGQDEQLLELKDEFESLRKVFNEREATYEAKILQLSQTLEREQKESQTLVKNASKQKPILLASITCDDMESGTNSPSANCKTRVKEFLKDFESSHFYEIVPIVDDDGFATLKRVQASSLSISKDEIDRLTRLSNLGLGKDRAASGGQLVDEFFEGLTRISYAVEGVEIKNKRGFIIKVYR